MKNKIEDLRDHLFATLEDLRDKEQPLDVERAKAIVSVAQVIVDSAKAENAFMEITGSKGSGFISERQLAVGGAPIVESRRLSLSSVPRCPDPNCGGVLSPQTNGNGLLKDVCDKCHRTVAAA